MGCYELRGSHEKQSSFNVFGCYVDVESIRRSDGIDFRKKYHDQNYVLSKP